MSANALAAPTNPQPITATLRSLILQFVMIFPLVYFHYYTKKIPALADGYLY